MLRAVRHLLQRALLHRHVLQWQLLRGRLHQRRLLHGQLRAVRQWLLRDDLLQQRLLSSGRRLSKWPVRSGLHAQPIPLQGAMLRHGAIQRLL
jgi:hypothetical protein